MIEVIRSISRVNKRGHGTHRFPGPMILKNTQDVKECGRSEEFLGSLPCRNATSIVIICGSENSQGKVLYVCGGCALDGDGIGGANRGAEVLECGKECPEEGTVRCADGLEGDANLGRLISTYESASASAERKG